MKHVDDFIDFPHRVTGASRLGDVWLTSDFSRDCGYELRVDLAECSEWADSPTLVDQSLQRETI